MAIGQTTKVEDAPARPVNLERTSATYHDTFCAAVFPAVLLLSLYRAPIPHVSLHLPHFALN